MRRRCRVVASTSGARRHPLCRVTAQEAYNAGSELRIRFPTDPRYQPFIGAAVPAKVLGCDARVASLRDLATGKIFAWSDPDCRLSTRKNDEAALIRLAEDYPEVSPLLPESLCRQL